MKKRLIAIIMFGVMLFTVSGCKKNPSSSSDYSFVTSEWEEVVTNKNNTNDTETNGNGNTTTNNGGSTTNNGGGTTTNSGGNTGGNSSGSGAKVSDFNLVQSVNIKEGTTPIEKGVDFGGKTFTMAITEEPQFHDAAFKRKIAAFEKTYNCKIKTVELIFGTYNTQIQQALSVGTSYDICFQHGNHYPVGINEGLYKSFSDVITTADLQNVSNPEAGGIDLATSSYFAYKGELYGLSHYYSAYPIVMYYNKKMCSAAGIDPQKLYDEGKWTWSYILQTGRKLTDRTKDVYFLEGGAVTQSYGVSPLTIKDGKPVSNLTSTQYINAINFQLQLINSATGIAKAATTTQPGDTNYERFYAGKTYVFSQETSKWSQIAAGAASSTAFGKSVDNIGIVPVPMVASDKNAYAYDQLRCITAGAKTKDIRVAACYAKFEATYVDAVQDKTSVITGKNKTYVDTLLKAKTKIVKHGRYATSSSNTTDIMADANLEIQQGGDVAQITKKAQQDMENCIKATWK